MASLSSENAKGQILFTDRVAVVTGAGAGLGRAYALELARRGAKVVVNDLGGAADGSGTSSRAADKVVEEIRAFDGQAVANYDSVASKEGGEAIVKAAIDAFGRLDILINNAGILRDKSFMKMTESDWKAVLGVHLDAAYYVTQPAFAHMREQKYGRIVLTTSAAGLFGNFGQANYSAAKMGLIGFMNTLKQEGARYDIHINTVAPIAATRLTEGLLPPDLLARLEPENVAPAVLYFCSEDCSHSGEILNAGGGYFSRSAIVTGPGAMLGTADTAPTPEQVRDQYSRIATMENAEEYPNLTAAMAPMMAASTGDAPQTAKNADAASAADIFAQMPNVFQKDKAAGIDAVFQYDLAGDNGGQWFVAVKDQTLTVEKGKHPNPTTTLAMSAQDFLDMTAGKLNPMTAYTSGKLKIAGDLMKSQLIAKLFKF